MKTHIESINRYFKMKRLVFLTNGLGEKTGHGNIPEEILDWYQNAGVSSIALIYLVWLEGKYGLMAIYEFDEWFRGEKGLSKRKYWKTLCKIAAKLGKHRVSKNQRILLGKESGCLNCHEIGIYFSFTDKDRHILKGIACTEAEIKKRFHLK